MEETTVVEQATPMDNNVTYENLTPEESLPMDETKGFLQNGLEAAVQVENTVNSEANAGSSMDNFLNNEYKYDHNEAGSYWVAGAMNDNANQMSFLNTLINEEMYDEMDLQKYYYDTNLASARAYAAQKSKETAYGFYRAAQEKAIAEGQLTGWYMPAEGQYMLGQYTVAQNKLTDPNATPEERSKASKIVKTTEKWFNANQISTRGIKCLGMMNYEENVRHNTIMGELKKQAGDLQKDNLRNSAGANELSLRLYKFQREEEELATGHNYTKALGLDDDNYIGHNPKDYPDHPALRGEKSTADLLVKNPAAYEEILLNSSRGYVNEVLKNAGYDAEKYFERYDAAANQKLIDEDIKVNGKITSKTMDTFKKPKLKLPSSLEDIGSDRSVYIVKSNYGDDAETRCYYKNSKGVFVQLETDDLKLSNGEKLSKYVKNFTTSQLSGEDGLIPVGDKIDFTKASDSKGLDLESLNVSKKAQKSIKEKMAEGYKIKYGYYSTKGINAKTVMENDQGELVEVTNIYGDVNNITKDDIKKIDSSKSNAYSNALLRRESDPKAKETIYSYRDSNGETIYLEFTVGGYSELGTESVKYNKISREEAEKRTGKNLGEVENSIQEFQDMTVPPKKTKEKPKEPENTSLDLGHTSRPSGSVDLTYDAQNTVDKKEILLKKYNVPEKERAQYANISNIAELEKLLKERYDSLIINTGR